MLSHTSAWSFYNCPAHFRLSIVQILERFCVRRYFSGQGTFLALDVTASPWLLLQPLRRARASYRFPPGTRDFYRCGCSATTWRRKRHTVFRGLDWTGLVKRGLVKRRLVKRGLHFFKDFVFKRKRTLGKKLILYEGDSTRLNAEPSLKILSICCCGTSEASEQQHNQDLREKYRLRKISIWSLFTRIHCTTNTFGTRTHCATNNSLTFI